MKRGTLLAVVAVAALLVGCAKEELLFTPSPDPVTSSTGAGGNGGSSSSAGGGGEGSIGWESGSRLRAMFVEGDDGSRQFHGWHDNERNEECAFGIASDGQRRCMPVSRAYSGGYFDNSGCQGDPLVPIFAGQCAVDVAVPKYGFVPIAGMCPARARVFLLGGAYGAQFYYAGTPGNCTPVPNPPMGFTLYELAQEIPADSLVEGTIVIE